MDAYILEHYYELISYNVAYLGLIRPLFKYKVLKLSVIVSSAFQNFE